MTDIRAAWRNQATEDIAMITLADIRERAHHHQSRMRLRNAILYLYSIGNIVAGLWLVMTDKLPQFAAPMLLMIVAHLFVLWQVWWRARARDLPGDLTGRAALDFHRQELERQHDTTSRAWLWFIAPFMPALVWELWIRATLQPANVPPEVDRFLVLMLIMASLFFWTSVWLWFSRAAARLETQLERLKGLRAE